MKAPRSVPTLLLLLLLLLAAGPLPVPAAAQDTKPYDNPFDGEPDPPLTPEQVKAAENLFAEAKGYVARGWSANDKVRSLFQKFLKEYPNADEDMVREAEDRSGENRLAGIELMHDAGPSARRIDVELMGDGYTREKFRSFQKDAPNQMKEFWAEPLYDEYENYFNVWRFDLISAEDGVDELSAEEKAGGPPPDPEPNGRRKKKGPKKYSTALNCVAAGGQNQVWADPEQVQRWRRYLPESDGLTIAFAKKGELGMGGGGIATTGKRVAVVHEFGHAFIGLLDEYVNNPTRPQGRVFAANAVSTDDEDPRKPPPTDEIPWKHWLAIGNKQVDVILGGATYQTGVFRPAQGCAMNTGGGKYCWVCREEGVLRIYSYVSPVDEFGPVQTVLTLSPGESKEFFVVPMAPKRHALEVDWFMQRLSTGELLPADPAPPEGDDVSYVQDDRAARMWRGDGDRGFARRQAPLPAGDPVGFALKPKVKKLPKSALRSTALVEGLEPGTWRLTARVRDDTRVPGAPYPWVIKDTARLREEWLTWRIDVVARAPEPAGAPPAK